MMRSVFWIRKVIAVLGDDGLPRVFAAAVGPIDSPAIPLMTAAAPIYDLENVTKQLEKAGAGFTLRIPRFAVRRGEFVAFVGESGCGKTTLLDLLGLISPQEAKIVAE